MPHDAGVVSIKLGYISMHGGRKKTKLRGAVSQERFLDAEDEKTCLARAEARLRSL